VVSLVFGFRAVKHKRIVENLPASPTSGVAYGLAEVKGLVDLPDGVNPYEAPLSRRPCVTYKYEIKEQRGSGKKRRWVTVHSESRRKPFEVLDRDGSLKVCPDDAEILSWRKTTKKAGRRLPYRKPFRVG